MPSVADRGAPFVMVPVELLAEVETGALSWRALLAYVGLRKHANEADGWLAFPSRATVGRTVGISEASAKRGLSELLRAGWIRRTRQPPSARGRMATNAYTVLLRPDLEARHGPRVSQTRGDDEADHGSHRPVESGLTDPRPRVSQTRELDPIEQDPTELEQLELFDSSPETLEPDTDGCAVEVGRYDTGEVCERCGNGVRRVSVEHGDIDPICADCAAELRRDGLAGARELYRIVGEHRTRNTKTGRAAQEAVARAPFMQPRDTP